MESSSSKITQQCEQCSATQTNVENESKVLSTLILKCKEEMEYNHLQKPLEDYIERVVHYTGLPKKDILQIISKNLEEEIDTKNKYFGLNGQIEIFKYITDMYTKQCIPTYKNIFSLYKTNKIPITFSQFQYMMHCLGFEYQKTKSGKEILLEDPSLTFERYLYLKNLNNLRAKSAPIYYIDARLFDRSYTFPKLQLMSTDNDVTVPGNNAYVFFHAVSKSGFLNGLFCSPATKTDFVRWISHILIPLLSCPSVIVIDNLYTSCVETITKYHSKADMLKYLRQKNIPCSEQLHRAELYELITKCTKQNKSYDIDEVLKTHGHTVLHLPANFQNLSLSQFLWEYFLKEKRDIFFTVDLPQTKTVLLESLQGLPQNVWESFHYKLVSIEENIKKMDLNTQSALDALL